MPTLICLVRHGCTDWNYEGRAQGHADIPLNAEGMRQAELVAARLAEEPWDALYSSPVQRAAGTARAISARTRLPVNVDVGLIERDFSPIEGTTAHERALRWPDDRWRTLPGIESKEAVAARATATIQRLAAGHLGGRIIFVTHGAWIHNLLESRGMVSRTGDSHQRNTAFSRLYWDGEGLTQEAPPDFTHLLIDGVEYSAERGRLADTLARMKAPDLPAEIVHMATAVESAWVDGRLVGFLRAFTDGVLHGYIDVLGLQPGYERVLPVLAERLGSRFPRVVFTRLPVPVRELVV